MDVYDISGGLTDSWFICGNSITAMTWSGNEFGHLVQAKNPAYFPAWLGGGVGFMTSADGNQRLLPKWLPDFPGKYVVLCYGTNDGETPEEFYSLFIFSAVFVAHELFSQEKTADQDGSGEEPPSENQTKHAKRKSYDHEYGAQPLFQNPKRHHQNSPQHGALLFLFRGYFDVSVFTPSQF